MKPEDWHRIETVFHSALPLEDEERDAYLARECSGDDSLRREVESLLAALKGRDGFMGESVLSLGMRVISGDEPEALAGRLLGSYRILRRLGRGGMGEVYLAEDTRLGRNVALKFLSRELVNDNWAKRQLKKEAQAVAMLDHPNICAVFGIEEAEGRSFIVMQYVEGVSLTEFIGDSPPGPDEGLRLAVQIVGAVAEAHAHGIIHRDIKPQNIMVTACGQVKVLDFGLAKIVQQQNHPHAANASDLSQMGLIPGTVAYMSPEQLRAERLDYRSDVFSCGTVLYEVFSGGNPFARASKAEIISAVLTSQPQPLRSTSPGVAPEIARLVHKCLEKDKELRYQSASELLYELAELQQEARARGWRLRAPDLRFVGAVALLVLLCVASAFLYYRASRVRSLAVLPISTEDASLEYLGDGLTETLISRLSPLTRLRVKPFTSVSGYKDGRPDPLAVGRELNVDAVLTGSFVRRGDALVLRTRLINTADGSEAWAGEYVVNWSEIITLPDELAKNVTDGLDMWLGGERKLLAKHGTASPEAFRHFINGRYLWRNRTKENIKRAIHHFNEAVRLDAAYAQAHAGLADCYVLLNIVAYGEMPTDEAMARASAAAKEALEIDDKLPEAHTSIGVVNLRYKWDWQESEKEFKRAIELKPDHAPAHYWYSNLLVVLGRYDEAVTESQIAKTLDPFSPAAAMNFCRALSFARRYDAAAPCFDKLLEEKPDYSIAQYMLGLIYQHTGRGDQAITTFRRLYDTDKSLAGAALGYAYARAGRPAETRRVLAEMEELAKQKYVPSYEFAILHMALGEDDRAFALLEQAYDERFVNVTYLAAEPLFSSLHRDARFASLVGRLNLPQPPPA